MKNLLNLFILPVFLFCSFLQMSKLNMGSAVVNVDSQKSKDQIVYLFFKVEKNNSGQEKITLEEKKMAEGKLKMTPDFDKNSAGIGDFIVSLTDVNGKEIIKQIVEDPLNQKMENFEKGIDRHTVSVQNAEFSVRYSYTAEIKVVKVEKITNTGSQLLFNQKL
ncbi:hypothetical protein M2347_000963 [Chryseobacterium sp. H1D6B]|uniref:hypothetical protein n=1 Tax=Chryseobacterium sp. H1D6B TaxID=2940588 RepID=UPI0015CA3D1B|nr:hypothetical protein [Chryseobacterium sp. H1D6B]MDH6251236.1 hypothetical protein [Chryseobacterium sp. H1D6B]